VIERLANRPKPFGSMAARMDGRTANYRAMAVIASLVD
jgi:hypothetical protein